MKKQQSRTRGPNRLTSRKQHEFLTTVRSLIDDGDPLPSIGEIALHVQKSKSTVHDMLKRLERRGLVAAEPSGQRRLVDPPGHSCVS